MNKSTEDVEKIKNNIIQNAIEIFSLKGYKGTNMDDISKAAGVSRGPLYYHFNNKKELYKAAFYFYEEQAKVKYISIIKQKINIMEKIDLDLALSFNLLKPNFTDNIYIYTELKDLKKASKEYSEFIYNLKFSSFQEALDNGELKEDTDIKELVDLIYVFYKGISALKKDSVIQVDTKSLINILRNQIFTNYLK